MVFELEIAKLLGKISKVNELEFIENQEKDKMDDAEMLLSL